jgi:hypothetical protein
VQEVVETFHTVWRNCLPGEGIFVEVSGFDDLRTTSDSVTDGIVSCVTDEQVLDEMRRLSEQKSGSSLALLFISLVLFSAVGAAFRESDFLMLLIPILMLHEF